MPATLPTTHCMRKECAKPFAPRVYFQRFCSDYCRITYHKDRAERARILLERDDKGITPATLDELAE